MADRRVKIIARNSHSQRIKGQDIRVEVDGKPLHNVRSIKKDRVCHICAHESMKISKAQIDEKILPLLVPFEPNTHKDVKPEYDGAPKAVAVYDPFAIIVDTN